MKKLFLKIEKPIETNNETSWSSGIQKFPLLYCKVWWFPPKIPCWYTQRVTRTAFWTTKKQFWHRQCAVGHRWRRSHDVTVRVYWSREKWGGWLGGGRRTAGVECQVISCVLQPVCLALNTATICIIECLLQYCRSV